MSLKYEESKTQREKEKQHRETVIEALTGEKCLTENEIADRLDVSRSTVQCEKTKLK